MIRASSKENLKPKEANPVVNDKSLQPDQRLQKKIWFEQQISINKNPSDRINSCTQYINWSEQFKDTDKDFTAEAYRFCLNKCVGLTDYLNDQRLINMFINYAANHDSNPLNIYRWMNEKKIGINHSFVYIQWFNALEKLGSIKRGIEVLNKGLEANAQPTEMLKNQLQKAQLKLKEIEAAAENESIDGKMECKKNYFFYYKLLYPDGEYEDAVEYQFEELRARDHYRIDEAKKKHEEKISKAFINEIESLKRKVEEAEAEKQAALAATDAANRALSSRHTANDYTGSLSKMNRTNMRHGRARASIQSSTTFGAGEIHEEMYNDNNDNLTNVTAFTTQMISAYDTKHMNNFTSFCNNDDEMDLISDEPKLEDLDDKLISSHLTEPSRMKGLTTTLGGGSPTIAFNFSPSDKTLTAKTIEARVLANGLFDKYDDYTCFNKNDWQVKPDEQNNTQQSIKIHGDTNNDDTNKIINKEQQISLISHQQSAKDFSIFCDNNAPTPIASTTETFKLPKLPATSGNKCNQDGSIFNYDPLATEKDLNALKQQVAAAGGASRKPLSSLDDIIFKEPDTNINFDFPTSSITKPIEFEPDSSSTRNLKPILNKFNQNEVNRLQTIVDDSFETSSMIQQKRDEEAEKDKMLNFHLNNLGKTKAEEDLIKKAKDTEKSDTTDKISSKIKSAEETANKNVEHKIMSEMKFSETTKQVKFNMANNSQITTCQTTKNVGIMTFWDYDYLEIPSNNNTDTQQLDSINEADSNSINNIFKSDDAVFQDDELSNTKKEEKGLENEEFQDKSDEKLTFEKLEQTFNDEYYKLYHDMTNLMGESLHEIIADKTNKIPQMLFFTDNMLSKIQGHLKTQSIPNITNETANITTSLTDKNLNELNKMSRTNMTLAEDTKIGKFLHNLSTKAPSENNEATDTTLMSKNADEDSTVYMMDEGEDGSNSLTKTTGILNNTVACAVRDPFKLENKNRLLHRFATEKLKTNPNYVCLRTNAPMVKEKYTISMKDNTSYKIVKEIGKGAYAKIYLIENKTKEKIIKYALKADRQSTAWEFYITETIHLRLADLLKSKQMNIRVMDSYVKMHQFMEYNDGCLSVMNFYKNGTLLELVNYHVETNEVFPYWFVLYLTLELLNIIDYLHKCNIIHADIKADNLLINQLPDSIAYFDQTKTKCLVLIDFNRSIDLELLPSNAEFDAKAANKSLLCCEMKDEKTWKYQIDYYGMLSTIHCIIFKKYMTTFNNGRNRITTSMPRSYDKIFANLFDTYLNIPSCSECPNLYDEWIVEFVKLFKKELSQSFSKSKKYLTNLNENFRS